MYMIKRDYSYSRVSRKEFCVDIFFKGERLYHATFEDFGEAYNCYGTICHDICRVASVYLKVLEYDDSHYLGSVVDEACIDDVMYDDLHYYRTFNPNLIENVEEE